MNFSEEISKLLKKKREQDEIEKVNVASNTENVSLSSSVVESDEKRANVINKVKEYNAEKDRINAIPDIVVEQKTYTELTDDELKNKAKEKFDAEYDYKKSILNDNKTNVLEGLNKQKDVVSTSSNEQKRSINEYYDLAEDALSNNALKRGIQRSSIVQEQIKELGVKEIDDLIKVDEILRSELNEIEKKVTDAQNDYASAVRELDFKKAIAVSDEVEKLKVEQQKKIKEIDDFNLKALEEATKANAVLNEQKTKQISDSRRNALNEVLNYFYSLPKADRYNVFMADQELQQLLGERDSAYIAEYLR